MDKVKPILKALLFSAIMLLFYICSYYIAKALKLSVNRTYVFQGGMMLLSTLVPLFYIGVKQYGGEDVGLNKVNMKSLKGLLFYIPLILAICALFLAFKKNVPTKSLLVQLFFYLSAALAAEIYFRGLIQKEFRDHHHVVVALVIISLLYAVTNLYYYGRITGIKVILVLSCGQVAVAGINGIIIEKKGNLFFTTIFNALYVLVGANYIANGKKILLAQGLSWVVLLIYGLFLLITFLKPSKPKEEEVAEVEEKNPEEEVVLEEPNMTLE